MADHDKTAFDAFARAALAMGGLDEAELSELQQGRTTVDALNDLIAHFCSPRVRVANLVSRPELNGRPGQIVGPLTAAGRWPVELDEARAGAGSAPATRLAIRPANLRPLSDESVPTVLAGAVGADLAEAIHERLACARCEGPCSAKTRCRVPHPPHLRQDAGAFGMGGVWTTKYLCRACGQGFALVKKLDAGAGAEPQVEGARWCFDGRHSSIPIAESDLRRISSAEQHLTAGPGLQAQLDALPERVVTLTVSAAGGFYDDSEAFALERRLPRLKHVQLVDVPFARIRLDEETAPALETLRLQNISDECNLQVCAPGLRRAEIHYWRADDSASLERMLRAATRLEEFDSYKLWVDELSFASNALTSVDLHRADSLGRLSLWAPNLESLRLQGCYSLERIRFLDDHALAAALPADHACARPLVVNTANACLGASARRALKRHPRVVLSARQQGGMPTEGLFASMRGMMGGDEPWDDESGEESESGEEEDDSDVDDD